MYFGYACFFSMITIVIVYMLFYFTIKYRRSPYQQRKDFFNDRKNKYEQSKRTRYDSAGNLN